jgi:hypothetical protein
MGAVGTGEVPSESLLKIVMSSSCCSTFTHEGRLG